MAIAIIGSVALSNQSMRLGLSVDRLPMDTDIIGTYDEVVAFVKYSASADGGFLVSQYPINGGDKLISKIRYGNSIRVIEAELAWPGSLSEELLDIIVNDPKSTQGMSGIYFASPSILLSLKLSHRYLRNSPHFLKTMGDIQAMRASGVREATTTVALIDFFSRRTAATYNYKHPKLNQGKNDFFSDDGVNYQYDHDTIHQAVAIDAVPAYTLYQKDGAQVACDSYKFFNGCTIEQRLNGVLEECYVLAIERCLVPFPGSDPKKAFLTALMKVCTSITSGWFREFAWENYDKVVARYDPSYVTKFQTALEAGKIAPFTKQY